MAENTPVEPDDDKGPVGATSAVDRASDESTKDDETPSFSARMNAFLARFKMDAHHEMGRFGVSLALLSLFTVIVMGGTAYASFQHHQNVLGNKAMYNHGFQSSKTQTEGTVEGIFSNKKHTKAMVLMKFSDPTKVSTDASQYQTFLTGANSDGDAQPIASMPSGSIYVFGTTGYMGVYLVDSSKFESQILSMTVRAKSEIVPQAPSADDDDEIGNTSFAKYDQWRVFFNPGASGTTKVDALESDQPSLHDLYDQMVVKPQEAQLRQQLDTDLSTMRANLTAIREYTKSLTDIRLPGSNVGVDPRSITVPKLIAGDQITGNPQDPVKNTPSTLALKTKNVIPGGYDFDWRSGSVDKGYLSSLVPAGTSPVDWMSTHSQASVPSLDTNAISPAMTDGGLLGDLDSSSGPVSDMNKYLSLLTGAYQTYYQSKQQYEITDLKALLDLDLSLQDVQINHSVNDAKTAVLVY